ncbi:DNA replication factor dna2 domain-containing protein [Ditylenchus destructor]|nr:DNA replication factor dna2 domain-containing protein [Ditylenchus destructor]
MDNLQSTNSSDSWSDWDEAEQLECVGKTDLCGKSPTKPFLPTILPSNQPVATTESENSWSDWDEAEQLQCIENVRSAANEIGETERKLAEENEVGNGRSVVDKPRSQINGESDAINDSPNNKRRNGAFVLQEVQTTIGNTVKRFRSDDVINAAQRKHPQSLLSTKISQFPHRTKITALTSGIDDFPALSNYDSHLLLKVISAEFDSYSSELQFKGQSVSSPDANIVTVRLKDTWRCTLIETGMIVRLIEPLRIFENVYELSSKHGLLIVEPETLISSTTMAQALYCQRKSVLQDRFKGAGTSVAMLLGTVVHEIFQISIAEHPRYLSVEKMLDIYRKELMPQFCVDMIALDLDPIKFDDILRPYLQNVCSWIKDYPKKNRPLVKHSSTTFDHLEDIEDNIWTPTIGFKGKIDVSFRSKNTKFPDDILPLELKTGKSYVVESTEHKTQVLIYSLMLSERYNFGRILPGNVLYLKDNNGRAVIPKAAELKGLLQMRNRLAPSFARFQLDSLPDPLTNSRLCSYCDHALTCSLAASDIEDSHCSSQISSDMESFFHKNLSHLNSGEIHYARKWFNWLFAEWSSAKIRNNDRRIFRQSGTQRQAEGTCLANMQLQSSERFGKGRSSFLLTFARAERAHSPLILESMNALPFEVGDMITISTEKAYAVAMGSIQTVGEAYVCVLCDKSFAKPREKNESYNLDKYTSLTSFSLNLNNVSILMRDTKEASKLRSLLIEKKAPSQNKVSHDEYEKILDIISFVDSSYVEMTEMALRAKDYVIVDRNADIASALVVTLVDSFLKLGKTILLTSNSSNSLNNICAGLTKHIEPSKILCIGKPPRTANVDSDVVNLYLSKRMEEFEKMSAEHFYQKTRNLLMNTPIIVSNCLAVANHSLFLMRRFDVCIVDNASTILEPTIIRPIIQADKFILLGDLDITPHVQNFESEQQGMDISLLKRLSDQKDAFVSLKF